MQNKFLNKKLKWKKAMVLFVAVCVSTCMLGCGGSKKEEKKVEKEEKPQVTEEVKPTEPAEFTEGGETFVTTNDEVYTTTKLNVRTDCSTDSDVVRMLPERAKILRIGKGETWSKISLDDGDYYVATEYLDEKAPKVKGHIIAIDATHQEKGNDEQEAIGPNATETKDKVSVGSKGVSTGQMEYDLTLQVAKRLQKTLTNRGYEVFMVRESNDVNLSNHERCTLAKESGAEIYIRLQANSSKVAETNGAMTICGTKDSPYVADLYEDSHRLSQNILDHYVKRTGAANKGIWETDLMAGINWSSIPVTVVEMGYLSNEKEDARMFQEAYQEKMATGIAEGVDEYYNK